ncbi:DUF2388 domain-containing protein [Pseudomonas sp. MIACH]|uniref:DUF2388 domain-containing protein n=1 Tax=Pseudomonas sp. MIACH TaxID=1078355 RepID=UPI00069D6753|nr:DUF2388 domain-containing protein [Pseudomonas sp. MIACH]
MDSWKTLAIAVMVLIGAPAVAAENANPFDKALMYSTFLPTILVAGTTSLTTDAPKLFTSSKTDALAFIGSDGEIRGAEFEQASRYYRSTYAAPLMSDMQLAKAIVSAY